MNNYSKLLRPFFLKESSKLGDRVLYSVDLNTSVNEGGLPQDSFKFTICANFLKLYLKKFPKSRFIILSHNGRPETGNAECISLLKHAEILSKHGLEVIFCNETPYGQRTIDMIKSLKSGQALLLENTRFNRKWELNRNFAEQQIHPITQLLVKYTDAFISDSYPLVHRESASGRAFFGLTPAYFGFYMQEEIIKTEKLFEDMKKAGKICFCIGGSKLKIKYNNKLLSSFPQMDLFTAGIPGQAAIIAKDKDLNEKNRELITSSKNVKNVEITKRLYAKFGEDRINHPIDFFLKHNDTIEYSKLDGLADKKGFIVDIGPQTVEKYTNSFNEGSINILAGPPGMGDKGFSYGTKGLIYGSKNLMIFGGHGSASLPTGWEWEELSKIVDHSVAGGAKLAHLSGYKLPIFEVVINNLLK